MKNVHCFTSATFSYLDRARVLAMTLKRFHKEWVFWLLLSDTEAPDFIFNETLEPFDKVVRITELNIPSFHSWVFKHDVVELCTAVKGIFLERLLINGADVVLYLDPDIAIFSNLNPVLETLQKYSIVLTPHLVDPEFDRSAILDNEIGSLQHGVYNLGFLGVGNSEEGCRFAAWWRERLLEFCYADVPSGLFTDQRWCDLVPAFFEQVAILKDPGYNIASWNLSRRTIHIDLDGVIRVNNDYPLRFFHFTKVNWVGEAMLERYASDNIEVFELLKWYRHMLEKSKVDGLPEDWWGYGCFDDGRKITQAHRLLYRKRPDLEQFFPNPFVVGPGSYIEWFDQQLGEQR